MGMHKLYEHFPIECRFKQKVYSGYQWKVGLASKDRARFLTGPVPNKGKREIQSWLDYWKTQGVDWGATADDFEDVICPVESMEYSTYEAFTTAELIPSLHQLVWRVRQGKDKKKEMLKWVSQYGFLGVQIDSDGHLSSVETLADFWREAEALTGLWDKFRQVTQRNLEGMREWVKFVPLHPEIKRLVGEEWNTKAVYSPFMKEKRSGIEFVPGEDLQRKEETFEEAEGRRLSGEPLFRPTLEEINDSPLEFYQVAGLEYILTKIAMKLRGVELSYTGLEKISNPQDDIFKLRPVIKPKNLLQAMYLQFYILLCGQNVKVCNWCGKPFDLKAKYSRNRKYCLETCKNTAKSYRYRTRQKLAF